MGAFGEIFGFDGRINRIGYLWRSLLAGAVIGVAAAIGVLATVFVIRPDGIAGAEAILERLTVGAVLLGLWSAFALAARRLRDMGVEPAHIVPVYAALWVVNTVLLEPMSRLDPARYGLAVGLWVAAQWLATLPLLFWPSRERPTRLPGYEPAQPTAYLNWRETH